MKRTLSDTSNNNSGVVAVEENGLHDAHPRKRATSSTVELVYNRSPEPQSTLGKVVHIDMKEDADQEGGPRKTTGFRDKNAAREHRQRLMEQRKKLPIFSGQ